MAWSTIRKADLEDYKRLNKTATNMIEKYNLELPIDEAGDTWYVLNLYLDITHSELVPVWKKRLRRALKTSSADGIAWGYVGRSVE